MTDAGAAGWITAGVTGISTVILAVRQLRKDAATQSRETRKDTLDEYRDLLTQMRADQEADRAEVRELADRHAACERKYERASERISHLEDALAAAGIKFRPWVEPGDGSGPHRPVPGGQP